MDPALFEDGPNSFFITDLALFEDGPNSFFITDLDAPFEVGHLYAILSTCHP